MNQQKRRTLTTKLLCKSKLVIINTGQHNTTTINLIRHITRQNAKGPLPAQVASEMDYQIFNGLIIDTTSSAVHKFMP